MRISETGSRKYIPIHYFDICLEDGKTREEISKLYTRQQVTKAKVVYFLDKFAFHLKQIGLNLEDYIKKNLEDNWPICPVDNTPVRLNSKTDGRGVFFTCGKVTKETNENFRKFCDRISESRKGKGNPMHGKEAWNKGLTSERDLRIQAVADKRRGRKASDETRAKQRQAREDSPLKARHTTPHSDNTKEKLRENTARLWSEGVFNRVSSIHLLTREFLSKLELSEKWEEEFLVKYYALDFAFPNIKVGIEVQGTYFHVDPRFYPNGPTSKIQRRNYGRDKAKRTYLEKRGWILIEIWETEINNGEFENYLREKLKQLNILK